jgi:hypothetical protein
MIRFCLTALFFLTCLPSQGQGAGAFTIPASALEADSLSLFDFAGYYCDSTGRLGVEDIQKMSGQFQRPGPPGAKFAARHLHWFYFRLDNRGGADAVPAMLWAIKPWQARIYQFDSRGLTKTDLGAVNRPRGEPVWHFSAAKLKILPGEETDFYVVLDDRPFSLTKKESAYDLALSTPAFGQKMTQRLFFEVRDHVAFSLSFLSVLFFLVAFTAFMYLQNRDRVYLYYALYVAALFVYYLLRRSAIIHNPLSYIHGYRMHLEAPLLMLTFIAYLYFIRVFLDVNAETQPRLDRVLRICTMLVLALMGLDALLWGVAPLHTRLQVVYYLQNGMFLAGAWVVFRVYQMGGRLSKFIVWGTMALVAGGALVVLSDQLKKYGGAGIQMRFFSFAQMGVLAETFIFALGLGYRTRLLREEKIEAELKALRAQMKPHFVFNSLNSIKDLIQKNRTEEAVGYLTKFARLMRGALKHSERPLIPLEDELEMCEHYLRLESLRFDHKFHFEIEAAPELGERMIPPLLFQPFLENAIWHGLLPKEEGDRWVKLSVFARGAFVVGRVEDNGVGRKPQEGGGRESFGLRLTQERLARQFPGGQVSISDKFDNFGNPAGTIIEISFKH